MGVQDNVLDALGEARQRTLALVEPLDGEQIERVHDPLMSPLVWDLGHIAAYEDLWLVHRHGGEPLLRADLADVYDAFETPRSQRGDVPLLRHHRCVDYLEAVRTRTLEVAAREGTGELHEMVLRHEQQHSETMLQTLQLARLDDYRPPRRQLASANGHQHDGLELVEIPGGPFELGASDDQFAYDNERPRHRVDIPAFRIGVTPVTNGTYLSFAEGGGYERREWWTREGWAWKEEYDISRPEFWSDDGLRWRIGGAEPLDPNEPVVHVSWFEADAFARSHGARLPTEAEWEKAATWDQRSLQRYAYPWGNEPPSPERHANVDQLAYGPAPAGAYPEGAAPSGCLGMVGDLWEWTSSPFGGYPGFRAHPYREYSEVFFGDSYRVLRGGSWATRARVATSMVRNWDLPQRRQIFAGFRIAKDIP
ncbi:MAG TPA: ergothioneine biosynthesis protein EgtB [Solirubrobacteraceae bacterium]|nr:ergothioneine biosynthesis protein EgtB [Solirubrobacteraceae bacterium]